MLAPSTSPDPTATAAAPAATVRVAFCERGNYRRVAERLLGALEEEFPGARIIGELEPAGGGLFEVSVEGHLVFSKRATLRLPEAAEIVYHVAAALPKRAPR